MDFWRAVNVSEPQHCNSSWPQTASVILELKACWRRQETSLNIHTLVLCDWWVPPTQSLPRNHCRGRAAALWEGLPSTHHQVSRRRPHSQVDRSPLASPAANETSIRQLISMFSHHKWKQKYNLTDLHFSFYTVVHLLTTNISSGTKSFQKTYLLKVRIKLDQWRTPLYWRKLYAIKGSVCDWLPLTSWKPKNTKEEVTATLN